MSSPSLERTERPDAAHHGRCTSEEGASSRSANIEGSVEYLGRYRLRRPLGRGAMGTVYEAEDPSLGRPVALKVLQRELSDLDRQRIQREALALATVGESYPLTLYTIMGLCQVERARGHAELAVELCKEVLERFDASPTSSWWMGQVSFALAQAQWDAGMHEPARRNAEQARTYLLAEDPETAGGIARWIEDPDEEERRQKMGVEEGAVEEEAGGESPAPETTRGRGRLMR